jgi:hypothetical protein
MLKAKGMNYLHNQIVFKKQIIQEWITFKDLCF